jgi:hypothetical protein
MDRSTLWRLAQALFLGASIIAGTSVLAATVPLPGASIEVAHATVAQGKDREDKDKNKNRGSDDDEDHVLNGQVLDIDTLKDPPEVIVGSVDGKTVVKVLKTDEIAINGIHLGDYIQANGEKQSEVLFEATQLSVSSRYGDAPENNNDNK